MFADCYVIGDDYTLTPQRMFASRIVRLLRLVAYDRWLLENDDIHDLLAHAVSCLTPEERAEFEAGLREEDEEC